MTEAEEKNKRGSASSDSGFFSVGPPLHAVRGGYVRRRADDALCNAVMAGRHAHIIAPARTGKTSLIAAATERLRHNGFKIAKLDLAQITERDGGTDAGRWYYSIAYRLMRQLRLKIDLQDWWQDKAILSNRQRLVEFYIEVILQNIRETVVVFLDEIQCVENIPFTEHLLPSVRAAHNARATEPDFQRLIFVLAGEGDPQSLFSDASLSPFNVSQAISLDDFTRSDIDLFATELNLSAIEASVALDRVFHWTRGQPYLAQKLCRTIARDNITGDIEGHVDRIALQQLAGRAALHSEPHMSHIHRRVVRDRADAEAMLNVYGRTRKGIGVHYDPDSRQHRKLIAIGLLVIDDDDRLAVRNRLYETVFTARWANRNLPLHWRGPAIVAALILLLTAIPFWYTQLLPKPYMRALVSPTLPLESVNSAWRSLRSFPGHVDTADRLYRNLLDNRARTANDPAAITAITNHARELPANDGLPERLVAGYWDRRAHAAMRDEQRDTALLAALQSLAVATPERRRLAATLIGDDYPQLIASTPPRPGSQLRFSSAEMLLSLASGARISQWSLAGEQVRERDSWSISSLEVTPLVRRVVFDRSGVLERIGLTVNVGHARLDDLRLKLIAPSGRTVELLVNGSSSSANEVSRFDADQLSTLRGEPVNGTWTLSLRDEATGVNGHLHGWNLSLNSQVAVESFDRGLDIPAPVERESDNIWFSDDGRYAVARALQSDNARMWNLATARPARSIAVPASEFVIGLAADARHLVTKAQNDVHLWNTSTGRREAVLDTRAGGAAVELTDDRLHLLVTRSSGGETIFDLWSLESRQRIAGLSVAGAPATAAIDAQGQRLAVADYDRAVRIWNLRSGEQMSQLDLHALASEMRLSADGSSLAVVHGDQGISLWRVARPTEPVVMERAADQWHVRFSPSGKLLLAGGRREGYQVYRTVDGALVGPPLFAGMPANGNPLLSFGTDEHTLVTGAPGAAARFWRVPVEATVVDDTARSSRGHRLWRQSGDSLATVAAGGDRLAIADDEGHVHTLDANASEQDIAEASDEINFLGHQGPVVSMTFSNDGSLIASAGDDGSVRVWDADTGLPRAYHTNTGAVRVRQLAFSPSRQYLAVLGEQQVWLLDVDTGNVIADFELGERHGGIAFGVRNQLYLGGESGTLRRLATDRVGNWNLRNVWQGPSALRAIGAATDRPLLVVVDAANTARLLDLEHGRLGTLTVQLPGRVNEALFSPSGTRVLLRTSHWIHRASVSSSGLAWLDALRAPKPIGGAQMVIDHARHASDTDALDPLGDHVLLLTRDAGFAEVAELSFDHEHGALLFGTQEDLLRSWRRKLAMPDAGANPVAVR